MDSSACSFSKWLKQQEASSLHSGTTIEINAELLKTAKTELARMVQLPDNIEPERGDLDDPKTEWRSGKPDYTLANLAFLKGKCMSHQKGTLEMIVQNAVKTWEMEASHKVNTSQWKTVVHDKYNIQANNMKKFYLNEAAERGNYNVLMDHVDKSLYDAEKETFESSHHLFQHPFGSSFPWEVLEVYSGPPHITFSWRHWGEFTGEYEGHTGDGELLEMIGFARVSVTDELKITDINVFYKPEDFLRALQGKQAGKLEEAEEKKNVEIFLENLKTQKSTFKLEINGIEADNNLVERFQTGFHADAIEIYSESAFSWSHQLSKSEGENDLAGFAILDRDESGKMTEIKVFYKPRDIAKESLEEMGLL